MRTKELAMRRTYVFFANLSLALGVAAMGCNEQGEAKKQGAPPPVVVAHPMEREVVDRSFFTGNLVASDSVEIRSRVNGYLDKIYFEVGSKVKKGDKLFQIDPRGFKASLEKAQGDLD